MQMCGIFCLRQSDERVNSNKTRNVVNILKISKLDLCEGVRVWKTIFKRDIKISVYHITSGVF